MGESFGQRARGMRAAAVMQVLVVAVALALLAATVLLVVPVMLVQAVGNPLPATWPSMEDLRFAVTHGQVAPEVWIQILAVVVWVAWAALLVSFVGEFVHAVWGLGGRAIGGLRAGRWLASRLVAQWALVLSMISGPAAAGASVSIAPVIDHQTLYVEHEEPGNPVELPVPSTNPASNDEVLGEVTEVTVDRLDTLWRLAERHLGSGDRWQEIRDLNIGRTMADGTTLSHDFTLLQRGWVLLTPGGATETDSESTDSHRPSEGEQPTPDKGGLVESGSAVEVAEGDTLWGIAVEELTEHGAAPSAEEVAEYVVDVVDANDQLIVDPDMIHPGETLILPTITNPVIPPATAANASDAAPVPASGQHRSGDEGDHAPSVPTNPVAGGRAVVGVGVGGESHTLPMSAPADELRVSLSGTRSSGEAPDQRDGANDTVRSADGRETIRDAVLVGLGAGAGFLAAGVLSMIGRRWRYRMAHRKPGTVPASLEDPQLAVIRELRDVEVGRNDRDWLGRALGSLRQRPICEGERAVAPGLVTFDEDELRLHLVEPDPVAAPMPWGTDDNGETWRLDRSVTAEEIPAGDPEGLFPLLVAVGHDTLINLEAANVLGIYGPRPASLAMVRSFVHELATSTEAGIVDVRSTFAIEGADAYQLVKEQSPVSLVAELLPWIDDVAQRLEAANAANAYSYRLLAADADLYPVVVITDPAGVSQMEGLLAAAGKTKAPLALVIAGLQKGAIAEEETLVRTRIELVDDEVSVIHPWAVSTKPQTLGAVAADQLASVLSAVADDQKIPLVTNVRLSSFVSGGEAGDSLDLSAAAAVVPSEVGSMPETAEVVPDVDTFSSGETSPSTSPLVVRVLGPVTLDGLDEELTSQQLSLLTFLACSGPSTKSTIINNLWDGQAISRSRFPNLLTELRSKVGRHRVPEMVNSRYHLQGVVTDLDAFEAAACDANDLPADAAARRLREVMAMVSGMPFTVHHDRFWNWVADNSQFAARTEALVADTALRLARHEASAGKLEAAQWACEKGLLAAPTDEHLVSMLAEVYVRQGRRGTALRLVESWEERISRLDCGDPSDGPRRQLGVEVG